MRRWILLAFALPVALASLHCGAAHHLVTPSGPSIPSPPATGSTADVAAPGEVAPPPEDAAPMAGELGPAPAVPVDFEGQVRPILEARCQPCHFEGGKMYEQMPFDSPDTIRELGTRLFTRIRDPEEQAVIRAFLGPSADTGAEGDMADHPPR